MCNASGVRYKVHHHGGRAGKEVLSEEHSPQRGQRPRAAGHHHRPLRVCPHVLHQGEFLSFVLLKVKLW